ncbi:hypothetical protein GUITHDRAFT_116805 [Guillardia theta CCMP2712]|uniref:Uncharacterized protein n=1 Tax=Guillardia theta (strain CCMP2712) TaxID=905079 RepID=L1ILF8_GUITC|nr:hypothetical protein GUITHDRAFT_116805 [Guillardia theta CCMP2712]EKX37081.1 hypothetical protein GUITHDRAFT_116805 [Guillardia theta CCMP2712]|eukprot:XP_005824061.1 hypothetical protein GUITHDRAFT_116805 [Guillardia theta CCMP2712]
MRVMELTSIQEALDKVLFGKHHEVIIIPDDEDNVVHGVLRAVKSKYKVFVKPGTHSWRGFIPLPFKSTMHLFAAGEDSTFQVEDRKVAGKVTLVGRWGSFLNLTLSWRKGTESRPTEEGEAADTFRSCLLIYGSPWLIENCECLSSGGVSMAVCGFGQATCRSCRMGGIEKEFPASCALFVNQGAKLLFKSSVAKYSAFGLYMDGVSLEEANSFATFEERSASIALVFMTIPLLSGVCLRGNAKVALWSSSMKQNMQSSLRVFANEYTDVELEDLESTDGKLWEDNNRPRRLVEKTVRWQPCEEVKSLLVDMYARMSEMSVTPPCLSHSSTGLKKEEVLELCDEESIEEMK